MKKILLLSIMAVSAVSVFADFNGNGYYRVQNALSKRYTYLLDNRGSVNYGTTSADVNAIHLYSDFDKAVSDPATVFYISNPSGSNYDIAGQGTGLYSFLGQYVKIASGDPYDGKTSYYIYASKGGMTKYLGDLYDISEGDRGYISVDAKGNTRLWYIDPVTPGSDNFFGVAPTVEASGNYYQPFYASFPFAPYSDGVKVYVVTEIDTTYQFVRIIEVTGNVPAGVPVIVECADSSASGNQLTIGPEGDSAQISANYLQGVYFDNDSKVHYNRTAFDKSAMRVLGSVDGQLMFVRGDYDFIPRNQAYLLLPEGDARDIDSYRVLKEGESAVRMVIADSDMVEVYRIDGTLVSTGMPKSEVGSLPHGLYLLRSGDVCEKRFVN